MLGIGIAVRMAVIGALLVLGRSMITKDQQKTKQQLIEELDAMRQRVAVLEAPEAEHKKPEEALPLTEKDYQRLFERFPIGITVVDMKGVILYCNPAVYSMGGYPEGDFTGKHFSEISSVRAKDIPKFIRVLGSIVGGKIPKPFETAYERNDGTIGWSEISIGLIKVGGKKRPKMKSVTIACPAR